MKNEESEDSSAVEPAAFDRRCVATCCPAPNCTKRKALYWSCDSKDTVRTNIMNHLISVHKEIPKELAMELAMAQAEGEMLDRSHEAKKKAKNEMKKAKFEKGEEKDKDGSRR